MKRYTVIPFIQKECMQYN